MVLFSKSPKFGRLLHKLKKVVNKTKKLKKSSVAQERRTEDTAAVLSAPEKAVAVRVSRTIRSALSAQLPGHGADRLPPAPQQVNKDVPMDTKLPWTPPCELESLIEQNTASTSAAPPNFHLVMKSHLPLLNEDDIHMRVMKQKVVLEYCMHGHNTHLTGVVRVHNMCYHKNVFVRITQDFWKSFEDVKADYVDSDGSSDRFKFAFTVHDDANGNDMQFAVCYQSEAGEFWDNNDNENYVFQFRYKYTSSVCTTY